MVNEMIQECLTTLFQGYLENGGTPIFSIGEIIKKHGYAPEEGGRILLDHGFVKHQQFRPMDFVASISVRGIREINPNWMNDKIHQVMSTLSLIGDDWQGLMEILEFEAKDYQIAFDISKELEHLNYVETQRHHNEMYVKLTPNGRDFCENNKADWI